MMVFKKRVISLFLSLSLIFFRIFKYFFWKNLIRFLNIFLMILNTLIIKFLNLIKKLKRINFTFFKILFLLLLSLWDFFILFFFIFLFSLIVISICFFCCFLICSFFCFSFSNCLDIWICCCIFWYFLVFLW